MMDCKEALREAGGDVAAAEEWLRKKLKGKMDARVSRAAGEGRIAVAVADDERAAAIVEREGLTIAWRRQLGKQVADKGVKFRIAAIGIGINLRRLCIARTAQPLCFAVGIGSDHNHFPICLCTGNFCLLATKRPMLLGFPLPFRPHSAIYRFADFCRQVDFLDPHIHHHNPHGTAGKVVELVAQIDHQLIPFATDHFLE